MNVLIDTLSSDKMWGAILASIMIIGLGYFLIKVKVLKIEWKVALNNVVLKIALPALALKGFMSAITVDDIKREGFVLGFSFLFYIVMLFLSKYIFIWVKEQKSQVSMSSGEKVLYADRTLMRLMWVFGSTTFFGFPIVEAVYGSDAMITANIFNIGYRVFLYSYAFSLMAGIKMDRANFKSSMVKVFKNPIVIATFIGLFIWAIQLATPSFTYKSSGETTFFDTKKTAPWLYKTFEVLGGLSSPLVWLSIGMTLSTANFKEAAKDKLAWMYVVFKQILLPAVTLFILIGFAQIDSLKLTNEAVATITVLLATPPATVVVAYAMQFKKSEQLASRTSVISTFAAVIAMPFWIVIANIVTSALI